MTTLKNIHLVCFSLLVLDISFILCLPLDNRGYQQGPPQYQYPQRAQNNRNPGRSNVHPQQVPKYQKYFPDNNNPPQVQYPPDVRGRSKKHPSNIPRFKKYFRGPPPCRYEYPENPLRFGPRRKERVINHPTPVRTTPIHVPNVPNVPNFPNVPNVPVPIPFTQTTFQPVEPVIDTNSVMNDHYQSAIHEHDEHNGHDGPVEFERNSNNNNNKSNNKETAGPCPRQPNHQTNGKDYVITEKSSNCPRMNKMNAVDFCKEIGMQGVTFDSDKSAEEKSAIMNMAQDLGLQSFWTTGFVSHPTQPNIIQTVTWSSASTLSTEEVEPGTGLWSDAGEGGSPQPDNYEYKKDPKEENRENCIAVVNNPRKDGVKFHDRPCKELHPVICEERNRIDEFSMEMTYH